MTFMTDITDHFTGTIHERTQINNGHLDLTVAEIYEIAEPGKVDFGGGELESAGIQTVGTKKKNKDDDYGWYSLEGGQYLLEYNEELISDATVTTQPRTELITRGAFHPTMEMDALSLVPLSTGGAGIDIKENARVSTVIDISREP